MRNKKIRILTLLIIIVFGSLVTLQIKYLISVWDKVDNNFSARVQQSLYQAEKDIKELKIERDLKKRYKTHNITENVSPKLKLEEWLNFRDLENILTTEFEKNQIFLLYHFGITDKSGKFIYTCHDKDCEKLFNDDAYKQLLFQDETFENKYTLKVYFPTKKDYIVTTLFLLISSMMLMIFLIILIIVIFYIFFKQEKLSAIKLDFMNNMIHELKIPISTVALSSQILQDKNIAKTPKKTSRFLSLIAKESNRLRFLVDKVLQVMMLEKENQLMNFAPTNVNELVKETIPSIVLNVENKDGKVIVELDAENPCAKIDTIHFSNVIYNLTENALKYQKKDVPLILKIKTWDDKNYIFVSVEDNGIGIKKEHLKEIFDKFYRIPTGSTCNVKGFGVGLAYVKQIIEIHKGTISVESECNVGTRFIISLPIVNL